MKKMNEPVVLFRKDFSRFSDFDQECGICESHFSTYTQRSKVPQDSLVIGRYSVLPYYRELEADLAESGSRLINTHKQHLWVANMEWYESACRIFGQEITPRTWFADRIDESDRREMKNMQFVVKGVTNSRKHSWDTMMFAPDFQSAVRISCDLRQDSLLSSQDIVFRQYVPLETFEIGINDIRFTNEWRFFVLYGKVVCSGYYWATAECADDMTETPSGATDLAEKLAAGLSDYCNFFVLDIARTSDGRWILIEVNDGQMSGLNTIPAEKLYSGLARLVSDE